MLYWRRVHSGRHWLSRMRELNPPLRVQRKDTHSQKKNILGATRCPWRRTWTKRITIQGYICCLSLSISWFPNILEVSILDNEARLSEHKGMVSLWSLAVVAFERFLVICKPMGSFTFRESHAITGCIFTWVIGLVAASPPLLGWSRYIPEGLQCSCGPDWYTVNNKWNNESYVLFIFCFCFGFPLAVIVFSYGRLLLTLHAVAKQQEQSATTQKAEREVTRMVIVMVAGFLVCWLPYASFALWAVTHRGETFDLRMASIPSVFSKASTVYNPFIYIFMNRQFRSCIMKLIFCGKNPLGDDDDTSASGSTQVSSVTSSQVAPA